MAEVETLEAPAVTTESPIYNEANWKTEAQIIADVKPTVTDPVIKEKDENITEKDTVVKTDEPSKTPAASPKPIQDRPADDNAQPKDEKKTDEPKVEIKTEAPKFANEESEKIYNALKEGKTDIVANYFLEKEKLTKAEGAEAIKLQLAYENKEFTQEEINDLFNEKYAIPEKPEQALDETDADYEARVAKHKAEVEKIEKRIGRDAKLAKGELLKLQNELVLPDIPKPEVTYEPTQEELDAQKKQMDDFLQSAEATLKNFDGYSTTFKDEEVEIGVAYKPTEEEKKELTPLLLAASYNAPEFFTKLGWLDDKGNLDTVKLSADLHLLQNRDKVFQQLVTETGTKRYAEAIKAQKNIDYSGTRRAGTFEAAPIQKEEKMVNTFFQS